MDSLKITEYHGIRVLTSAQVAQMYGTDTKTISYNFSYNKKKYTEGKHYVKLEGEALRQFKASREIPDCHKYSAHLYLWTEKGALLHAKSLNTDKAWEAYDYLVDFYFHVKEEIKPVPETKPIARPFMQTVVDVPENPEILNAIQKIKDDVICMQVLLDACKVYIDEESYKEKKRAAAEVVNIIVKDMSRWLEMQPKLIQKQY